MFLAAQLAAIGGIRFSLATKTADVSVSELRVNPNFWANLNEVEKGFLIDHEMMHLLLKHHSRFTSHYDQELVNVAADLAINSLLVDQYCGDRDPSQIIPFLYQNGMFPELEKLPRGQSTDFYIELLAKDSSLREKEFYAKPGFGGKLKAENSKAESACEGYSRDMTDFSVKVSKMISEENPKFEEFIKELTGNSAPMNLYTRMERWTYNRRAPWSNLPAEVWSEGVGRVRKNKIGLFLDYSGSCECLVDDFEKAAAMIPSRLFVVTKFRFASHCVKWESQSDIGGGTNFSSMLTYQDDFDQIWVFSDGDGFVPPVNNAKKWIWFLGGPWMKTSNLAEQSFRIINLSKFVDI